jgi:hypothetical protein
VLWGVVLQKAVSLETVLELEQTFQEAMKEFH